MAMIKCPECGREISSFAPACPGCGVPQDIIKKMLAEGDNKKENVTVQGETIENATIDIAVLQTTRVQNSEVETAAMQTVTVQTKFEKIDTVMKPISTQKNALEKNVIETHLADGKLVNCAVCKNAYSMVEVVCPKCKYPVFTVWNDSEKLKVRMKVTWDESGMGESNVQVGEYFKIGRYGGEEINWRVLAVENRKVLLISEKGLDAKSYHDDGWGDITWENCTLRPWLNREFLNTAFSVEEKSSIAARNDTGDKVFLLSIQEVEKYFKDDEDRKTYATKFAKENGADVHYQTKGCTWWLRSSGDYNDNDGLYAVVEHDGKFSEYGELPDVVWICVRPAVWITLESLGAYNNYVALAGSNEDTEKDSANARQSDYGISKLEFKVGQYHKIGYYQDEKIYWRVLAVEDGKALLLSEKGLDAKPYYDDETEDITWENSTLRHWLNRDFLSTTFTKEEKSRIVDTKVNADKNSVYDTYPGNDTRDQIFLLSVKEAEQYFVNDEDRKAYPTEYAKKRGANVNDEDGGCFWWLRTPGKYGYKVAYVLCNGEIDEYGDEAEMADYCVRPAMWIKSEI